MKPKISEADFDALIQRAGLDLTAAQKAVLHQGYAYVEVMTENVRTPRGREAEPATIFVMEVPE
jgi:hypothetical protein